MTLLWAKYKKDNGIVINSEEDILEHRVTFRDAHIQEIYHDTVTLCEYHHMSRLHKLYGKVPPLHTAGKQKRWCDKQRAKNL